MRPRAIRSKREVGGRNPNQSDLDRGVVLVIFGPTASGKTAVAEALARRIEADVVSADSMQVYRGLPILTNQPSAPAHLVAVWTLEEESSVAEFGHLAHQAIDAIIAHGRTPIVAGGTGLYLRAAIAELEVPPPARPGARSRYERVYDRVGPARAHELLARRDPGAAERIHPNDRRRVVRALELADAGSSLRPSRDRLWTAGTRHPTVITGLDVPREELERRIEERTREMFARGVVEEVADALGEGISATARQVIGLREIAELPENEAMAAIIVRTRRYAAYQRKWMRRIPGLVSVPADRPPDAIADEILEVARARQRLPADRAR
jgi:tRNA dimethylallyltransferase